MPDDQSLERRVVAIVADALGVDEGKAHLHSSLIDDLGAESIDFLDLVFRLETAFGIKISEDDIWKGSLNASDPEGFERRLGELRARMPEFRWDRLPEPLTADDLPRLLTVQTIVDYLRRRGVQAPISGSSSTERPAPDPRE